ncbi:MAG: hypothetical protein KatS3mg113_0683 [Planctomycetaceae bacterium]|nr:MAG: hypothetical protein KatS3mg113_0683 [Planctomycetaceae bacterium]
MRHLAWVFLTAIISTEIALAEPVIPAWVCLSRSLWNCPFCSAPSLTMAEQLAQSDAVLLTKWVGGRPGTPNDSGTTELAVVEALKQPAGFTWKPEDKLTLVRHRAAKPGTLFLLMGTKNGTAIDWSSPLEVSQTAYAYFKQAPPPDKPTSDRLRYYVKFLEHPEEMIATDAYGEFANAPYGDIVPIAQDLPREKLRQLVADPKTPAGRLGLYGLLLGLCGHEEDVAVLEQRILQPAEEFRLGIDGVMGGYLLLAGEAGLSKLEQAKVIPRQVPFSETYAVMQAVRFMWQYGEGRIAPDRLRQSMRLFLDRPELADLVIADLARMKDWSVIDRLRQMYGQQEFDVPAIKRAIVRFYLACVKDGADHAESPSSPGHRAQNYLQELEKIDPKTVSDAKRFFFIK